MKSLCYFVILLIPASADAYFRGNLNINYQEREAGIENQRISTFGQILNINAYDKIFYGNDLSLGAYISRSKASNRVFNEMRIRYSLNLNGNRYAFYSSYSPYKIQGTGQQSIKVRQFQSTLTFQPQMLPGITSSYASTRQKGGGNGSTINSFGYTWNIATSLARSFGTFRTGYQRQQSKPDIDLSNRQVLQSISFAYDISKQWPAKITWSSSYSFTGARNENWQAFQSRSDSKTHNIAAQFSRRFGRWYTASLSSSLRNSNFNRQNVKSNIKDYFFNLSNSLTLRHNLIFTLIRGYSVNKVSEDSVIEAVNDYLNFSGNLVFVMRHAYEGRFTLSRTIYFESIYGNAHSDNGSLIFDIDLYRQTLASVNLGLSRNSYDLSGRGRFQSTRGLSIQSRPLEKMNINLNYQSSIISRNANYLNSDNENLTTSLSHLLKSYFNYSLTYSYSLTWQGGLKSVSTLTAATNLRLSRSLSLLGTYSRRDIGLSSNLMNDGSIDQAASIRVSWLLTRKSNVTVNYGVSGINTVNESASFGGYYSLSF